MQELNLDMSFWCLPSKQFPIKRNTIVLSRRQFLPYWPQTGLIVKRSILATLQTCFHCENKIPQYPYILGIPRTLRRCTAYVMPARRAWVIHLIFIFLSLPFVYFVQLLLQKMAPNGENAVKIFMNLACWLTGRGRSKQAQTNNYTNKKKTLQIIHNLLTLCLCL